MQHCGWAFHQVRRMGGSRDKASSDNWPDHDDSSSIRLNDSTLRKAEPGNSMYSFAHPSPCFRLKQRQMMKKFDNREQNSVDVSALPRNKPTKEPLLRCKVRLRVVDLCIYSSLAADAKSKFSSLCSVPRARFELRILPHQVSCLSTWICCWLLDSCCWSVIDLPTS